MSRMFQSFLRIDVRRRCPEAGQGSQYVKMLDSVKAHTLPHFPTKFSAFADCLQ